MVCVPSHPPPLSGQWEAITGRRGASRGQALGLGKVGGINGRSQNYFQIWWEDLSAG